MSITIPENSQVYQSLKQAVSNSNLIVLCGLPGVGKSLYTLAIRDIAKKQQRSLNLIQWDIARKQYESQEIQAAFPLGDGLVHNGVKLSAGHWLMSYLTKWIQKRSNESLLVIEAPLIGHRFIELAKRSNNQEIEALLNSKQSLFLCPIPSKELRSKIARARKAQLSDDAKTWIGAKPKVMKAIWEHLFEVANILGFDTSQLNKNEYAPLLYDFVYGSVLKNRNYQALYVHEIFKLNIQDESELHHQQSTIPSNLEATASCKAINISYPNHEKIDEEVAQWYLS